MPAARGAGRPRRKEISVDGFSALARILKLEGVEWVACYPSNNLIESVAQEGIRTVMFRHERGAVMAADGYSRASCRDKFGVVITQGASGAENAMGGIAQAFGDNVPVLLLPGGASLAAWGVKPNFSPARAYAPISKQTEVVLTPSEIGNAMRRAFHALRNGRGGPVTVETPADVMGADVPDGVVENYRPPKRAIMSPSRSDVKDAVGLLLGASNPVLWAGGGVLYGDAADELKELAELLDAPVYTTMQGKSAFPETHPLSLGAGSGATTAPAFKWLQECDVLFAIGSSLTHTGYGQPIPPGKVLIQNTDNIEDINKQENVDVGLPGDAKATLAMAIDEVKAAIGETPRNTGVRDRIAAERERWMEEWTPLLQSDETPINTYRVIHEINTTLDKSMSVVTHDAGAPRDSIIPFYEATTPHGYVGWGKTTHLGFGIPLMIGSKLASPDKFCLNLMGDGAFGMSGMDTETAQRAGAPITTVVLNNGGMATYPGGYPTARTRFGVTQMTGDYAGVADAFGGVGITVTDPAEMKQALIDAQSHNADGRTVIIDVHSNFEAKKSRF